MNIRKSLSILSKIEHRQITGAHFPKLPTSPIWEELAKEFTESANNANDWSDAWFKTIICLARLGSPYAQDILYLFIFATIPPQLCLHYYNEIKQTALVTKNPGLLINCYCIRKDFNISKPALIPDIEEAMTCLENAAEMKGDDATQAAYKLAYIFASELGYLPKLPNLEVLSDLYQCIKNRFSNDEAIPVSERDLWKSNLLYLARLGHRESIERLIDAYNDGFEELNIERDSEIATFWENKLESHNTTLQNNFERYFNIAVLNTLRFGQTYIGDTIPLIDLDALREVHNQLFLDIKIDDSLNHGLPHP